MKRIPYRVRSRANAAGFALMLLAAALAAWLATVLSAYFPLQ